MTRLTKIEEQTPAPARKVVSLMLFSFLITFALSRLYVYSEAVGLIPSLSLKVKGLHVHHFTYGVFIIGFLCFYLLLYRPKPNTRAFNYASLIYGIGLGLTFDEFGMWVRLEDDYWVRQSYDAIIIISLVLFNIAYFHTIKNYLTSETSHIYRFVRWLINRSEKEKGIKKVEKKIKAIIFDFDGVIHDTFDLAFGINKQLHDMSEEEYRDMFNGNIYQHKVINVENITKFFEISNREFQFLKIENHIREGLEQLKRSFDLFIVSSNMELALNMYFENNNIKHIFREVLGMESHKSKIEKFKILMDKYKLNSENCIFVTDTLGDILEANKLGLRTVAVDYGYHDRKRLERGNPYKIISDFKELLGEMNKI